MSAGIGADRARAGGTGGLRIVIAEDAAIMRDGLTQTLSRRGHDVVAAVADAEALMRAVKGHLPDVAIIDVRMPPTHTDEGLQAALAIRREHSGVGVLVFSQYIEARAAAELLAGSPAGIGYLLKDGWRTPATSSRPSAAWRAAVRCLTPKWSGSFSAPAGTPIR